MKLRPYPFLRFLIPFASGIALAGWLDAALPGLFFLLIAGSCLVFGAAWLAYGYRWRWVYGSLFSILLLLAGYGRTIYHNEARANNHFSSKLGYVRFVAGTVYDAPGHGARLKVPVRVEAVGPSPDSLVPAGGNLLLFLPIGPETDSLRYGDRLLVRASIRPTEPPKNPYAFDYGRYLHFHNLHFQAFVKADSFCVTSKGHGYWLWRTAFGCRERLLSTLREHFPTQDEYAVASALLVGYQDDLSDDLRTAYAQTGSMHALAVSGTHVGMLYAGLMFLLGLLRLRGRRGQLIETVLVLLAIWGFTFITGATASVLRASVMFTTFLLGKSMGRNASIWNILASSAFLLLLFNPYFLFDAGFQLSYAAVAGMVYFYPRFVKISPTIPKWMEAPWKLLLIGFAAQLGTLPLSLYYFHQFPVYFWLAGWVVVLGGAIFLGGGALLVLLHGLAPVLAAWLGQLLYWMLWGMNRIIFFIQDLPGSVVAGIWLPGWAAVLLYAFLIIASVAVVLRSGRWVLGSLSLIAVLSIGHAGRALQQSEQRQITVYQLSKAHLIDCFDGQGCISLADSISPKQLLFAAQSNRWASGIRHTNSFDWVADTALAQAGFYWKKPFMAFQGKRMALLDDPSWVRAGEPAPLPVDVLYLCGNLHTSIADCVRRLPCRLLLFDGSNSRRRVEGWKKECRELGLAYHDLRENGAWQSGALP